MHCPVGLDNAHIQAACGDGPGPPSTSPQRASRRDNHHVAQTITLTTHTIHTRPTLLQLRHDLDTTHTASAHLPLDADMAPSAIDEAPQPAGRNPPKPPPKLWSVSEPPFEGFRPVDHEGWSRSNSETAIVIDNGTIHASTVAFLSLYKLTHCRLLSSSRRMVL